MFFSQFPYRVLFVLVFMFFFVPKVMAQPTLPDLANVSQNGINIITWANQYDGVKTIIVQRSSDSNVNYVTIGYVKNTKKGIQYFLDGHSKPGPNWYRIKLIFGSDLSWTSNRIKVMVDSIAVAKGRVLPPNDSLQDLAAKFQTKTVQVTDTNTGKSNKKSVIVTSTVKNKEMDTAKLKTSLSLTIELPDIENVNAYSYIKSNYVFTNPFTGHVNIEIDDAKKNIFNIDFYDSKNVKILEIPRISEPNVILDKRNFQGVGMYKFDLYRDKVKLETGYITIY